MNMRQKQSSSSEARVRLDVGVIISALIILAAIVTVVYADVPDRQPPRGAVPNPGAQQQELPNITFPAPYNIFEFPVTCMACHGGTIDQSAGHGSNWAGTNMASATRDPVFRASQIATNGAIKNLPGGADGAGNMCFRCHSPNAWLSGRADPLLGGSSDGRDIIQSILLSTDNEGVQCEQCHRAIGAVTMRRPDLDPADPVWNMMVGPIGEWPHASLLPYPAGDGNPFGDATLQYHDGMSYGAKYGGNVELFFSDLPGFKDLMGLLLPRTGYTGQTYGVYPWWYTGPRPPPPPGMPMWNELDEELAYNYDGTLGFQFEAGVKPDDLWGAISPEHSTRISDYVKSSEFCGSCHEVSVPILEHGMYQQRTYTEWKYSAFGRGEAAGDTRCQGCHMPTLKHEYADDAPVSINPDPLVSGWYPYARDRNIGGGTAFHKLAGANRNLPKMMKVLYPEVDLEVLGAPTGHDPRIFPGMLSDRGPMWDRTIRNTEISLRDAVDLQIISGPVFDSLTGKWEVRVKVTNNGGHKLPSGYPDGRRMWINLVVRDAAGGVVYQSGHYDPNSAELYTDASMTGLVRAVTPLIDSATNAVMIYEKRTGADNGDGTFTITPSLLNKQTVFDNRIPPAGFSGLDYALNGAGFWTYSGSDGAAVPSEDPGRYPEGQNWDEVVYTFAADPAAVLSARAELLYQEHSREFMEHLKDSIQALPAGDQGPRPEGPPNPLAANYPLTPTYLSDSIKATTGVDFATMTDLAGNDLQDNWGGVAYAGWLLTGKGAPFVMDADDTAVLGPPDGTMVVVSNAVDPVTGVTDPNVQEIRWNPVPGADGYLVKVRYGLDPLTSDWDKLAVVPAPETILRHEALNVAKTFGYSVTPFNAKGYGPESAAVDARTPSDLPLPPINTRVVSVTDTTVTLAWYDQADNETGFVIQRQDVPVNRADPLPPWVEVARIPTPNNGGFGGVTWTDTGLMPGRTYNYRVASYNASGQSTWDLPVAATTTVTRPNPPTGLTATGLILGPESIAVRLVWTSNSTNELGFYVERAPLGRRGAPGNFALIGSVVAGSTIYLDGTVAENTTYFYRVYAYNNVGSSAYSNVASVLTPIPAPIAPSNLDVIGQTQNSVTLQWVDNSQNETSFELHRALIEAGPYQRVERTGPNATQVTNRPAPISTGPLWYRVRACNAGGCSAFSAAKEARPQ